MLAVDVQPVREQSWQRSRRVVTRPGHVHLSVDALDDRVDRGDDLGRDRCALAEVVPLDAVVDEPARKAPEGATELDGLTVSRCSGPRSNRCT